MSSQALQFLFSGVTVGAIYALVGLGFNLIYNASRVINFAQGEFVMIGGMATVFLIESGMPMPAAIPLAIAAGLGRRWRNFAVEPARAGRLIIITIGASIFLRGGASRLGQKLHALPAFTGDAPITLWGATILPQSLWVLGVSLVLVVALRWFFARTLTGKAMLATANNRDAAQLVGINVRRILLLSFALSATLGAMGGILVAPITLTAYDIGTMIGLKGFAAAILGGLGSGVGAILGGLILGVAEAFGAGYLSSAYKDAIACVVLMLVRFLMRHGLLGARAADRV